MDESLAGPGKLLRPSEVAIILSVSRTQVYRLIQNELPCVRFGSTVRVRRDDLDQFISGHLDKHSSHSQLIER